MGEAIVSTLSEKLTSMLAHKIFQEVSLVTNFREDVESICDELDSIKILLNGVMVMTNSHSTTNWLHKVQDFLYRAVDIVEECEARKFSNPLFRYRMGRRIKTLKTCISKIHSSAKYLKYLKSVFDVNAHVHALNANSEDKRKKSSADLIEISIVGMEAKIKDITGWILQPGFTVIAVVGIGGLGKTLVVQKVLDNPSVQQRFDHVVWLAVSQKYIERELLLEMGKRIKLPISEEDLSFLEVESLKGIIKKHLENKRCLLVLDDVWAEDCLKDIVLQMKSGRNNKIVVTTRNKQVGISMEAHDCCEMEYLSDEKSLQLFYIHAFPDCQLQNHPPSEEIQLLSKRIVQQCGALPLAIKTILKLSYQALPFYLKSFFQYCSVFPENTEMRAFPDLQIHPPSEEMKHVSECIVQKCGGLPLAIKTIAASLARVERIPNLWESTLQRLNQAEALTSTVMPSLSLSYHSLPYHLKSCFMYCSVFPKNTAMRSQYLVYSWIAEGFVSTQIAAEAYDIGLSYIQELADRCLIEVSKVGGDGRIKYCKIHALLHELALSESRAGTKCLLKPGEDLENFPADECLGVRRISLVKNNIKEIKDAIQCPDLRTLLLWNNINLESISSSFFKKVRYLAVLDLSQTSMKSLPRSIGKLKHLKFLNLSRTNIVKLPSSLSGLWRLQFLDVSCCKHLRRLHSGIGKHKSMLHLNVKRCKELKSLPTGIAKLSSLQTLKGAVFRTEKQLADLKELNLLQHLSLAIDAPSSSQTTEAYSSSQGNLKLEDGIFKGMTKLRTVSLRSKSSCRLDLPKDMELIAQHLQHVRLHNCSVPKWIFPLENLMVLVISAGNIDGEQYKGLEKIPNLKKLRLAGNKDCEEFPEEFGNATAFPNLKKLVIEDFNRLKQFPDLQGNAMLNLQYLRIKKCNHAIKLLQGFDKLKHLNEIEVEEEDLGHWTIGTDRPVKINVINPSEEEAIEKMVKEAIKKKEEKDESHKPPRRTISRKVLAKLGSCSTMPRPRVLSPDEEN